MNTESILSEQILPYYDLEQLVHIEIILCLIRIHEEEESFFYKTNGKFCYVKYVTENDINQIFN